jgi:multicomponent Na+:H+ antiporter subunit E
MSHSLPIRLVKSLVLGVIFVKELVLSSYTVARQVLGERDRSASAIIAVPVGLRTAAGVTTLANVVSLTPGTTSLHISDDMKTLYVHVLDAPSTEAVIAEIKDKFESRILEIEA